MRRRRRATGGDNFPIFANIPHSNPFPKSAKTKPVPKHFTFFVPLLLLPLWATAQNLYPIRTDNRWGLIDESGNVVVPTRYNAIGEFDEFGFAVMQRGEGIGVLDQRGEEILPPEYEDIKVLSEQLISVKSGREWRVVNLAGRLILEPGYERLDLLAGGLLAYRRDGLWGVVNDTGTQVLPPQY